MGNLRWGRRCVEAQGAELRASAMQTSALRDLAAAHGQVLLRSRMCLCIAILLEAAFIGYAVLFWVQESRIWFLVSMPSFSIGALLFEWSMCEARFSRDDDELQLRGSCNWLSVFFNPEAVVNAADIDSEDGLGFLLKIVLSVSLLCFGNMFNIVGLTLLDETNSWMWWMLCLCALCVIDSTACLTRLWMLDARRAAWMGKLIGEQPKSP